MERWSIAISGRIVVVASLRWRVIRSTNRPSTSGRPGVGSGRRPMAASTWKNVSDGYFKWASVGALAVAPSDPNVIYAGMGETTIRGNVSRGDGVYKSTDAGQTWQHMGLAADAEHRRDLHSSDQPGSSSTWRRSGTSGGRTPSVASIARWMAARTGNWCCTRATTAGAVDLAMDPTNPRILYAAIWEGSRGTALSCHRRQASPASG